MSANNFDQVKLANAAAAFGTTPEKMIRDFERILSGKKVCAHYPAISDGVEVCAH